VSWTKPEKIQESVIPGASQINDKLYSTETGAFVVEVVLAVSSFMLLIVIGLQCRVGSFALCEGQTLKDPRVVD